MHGRAILALYGKNLASFLVSLTLLQTTHCVAQLTAVRLPESATRGFLVVRNQAGANVGSGEFTQLAHGTRVSARLILRLKDGSVGDETTDYSQDRTFRLIRYHHIQRGPSFPHPVDVFVDLPAKQVKSVPLDSTGKPDSPAQGEHMELPEDLTNGLIVTLLKNLQIDEKQVRFPYLAFAPKARLVKLAISKVGQQSFRIGGHAFRANHYVIKPEIGGVAGLIAPLVGKQPEDINLWFAVGTVPVLARVDQALYDGGPILTIQLAGRVGKPAFQIRAIVTSTPSCVTCKLPESGLPWLIY